MLGHSARAAGTCSARVEYSKVEEGLPVMAEYCLAFTGSGTGTLWAGSAYRWGTGEGLEAGRRWVAGRDLWAGVQAGMVQGVKVRVLEDGTDGPGLGKHQEGPWW